MLPDSASLPLCVDLDETFSPIDTLYDHLAQAMRAAPLRTLMVGGRFFLHRSRSRFKAELADIRPFSASGVPVREEVVNYLEKERQAGRKVYLVTAADLSIAQAIATAHPCFDGVWGSSAEHNLKSANKAEFLAGQFGPRGFAYLGDHRADIPVWRAAGQAMVVAPGGKIPPDLQSALPDLIPLPVKNAPGLTGKIGRFLRRLIAG